MKIAIIFALSVLILETSAGLIRDTAGGVNGCIKGVFDLILDRPGAKDQSINPYCKKLTTRLEGILKRNKGESAAIGINYYDMEEDNIFEEDLDNMLYDELWGSADVEGRRIIRCVLNALKEYLKCAHKNKGKEEECAKKVWRKLYKCFHDGRKYYLNNLDTGF